jgi:DNA-binding NarL/FixJ family response regulator
MQSGGPSLVINDHLVRFVVNFARRGFAAGAGGATIVDMYDKGADQPAAAYRVVVADDAAGMRELMRTLLSLEPDFEVVGQAGNGAEAVALVAELEPDLVVIDVSMPVLDGPAAIAQIRQLQPATKVAVLSAEQCPTPPGADAHIEKGTPNDAVIAALRTLCQRTRESAVD